MKTRISRIVAFAAALRVLGAANAAGKSPERIVQGSFDYVGTRSCRAHQRSGCRRLRGW